MRLQRLEIAGFKSFPDRSELNFDQGVTAIVGPNGCGKSNVVDALTWVLGEQSAKSLRGDRMEDVIFGGSDARKPTAAAEVRLHLAAVAARVPGNGAPRPGPAGYGNGGGAGRALLDAAGGAGLIAAGGVAVEDETPLIVRDVQLMRRLYRSGESEYLIDGETCRLRDVQDLLMDAGLGIKAYAVIEQGKIGQILSARPTERRQLIEEAAGVTKYKSRRRSAELKLEAAQQNLTRVDDIVFEVEKQRGALKRQAAKARRYKRLREELRRWEKVQFTHRYRLLGQAIEDARGRLADARAREVAAAAHVAEVEAVLERLRLELIDVDGRTTAAREAAHASELEMGRLQQQIAFDRQQVEHLGVAAGEIDAEVSALDMRREPARQDLVRRRAAAARAVEQREEASAALAAEEAANADVARNIEGLEADVEAARSEVYAAVNAAAALRHAMEHAAAARTRLTEQIAKLEAESTDLGVESERAARERVAAEESIQRAREAMDGLRIERGVKDSELAGARADRDMRAREFRVAEHEIAAARARLQSLEELDAARAEYGDGARLILAESGHRPVGRLGSVADYLEVERGYERGVEACLGDLLQHVVVETHDESALGLQLARELNAGRVGFLIARNEVDQPAEEANATSVPMNVGPGTETAEIPGLTSVSHVIRVGGPAAEAIRAVISNAWIADGFDAAQAASAITVAPVATLEGDVFHGAHRVVGGARAEARGILTTKREIKEIRERVAVDQRAADRVHDEIAALDVLIASAESAIVTFQSEVHRQEKATVGFDAQRAAAADAAARVARKQDQVAVERRTAEEELRAQEGRYDEARQSIVRIEAEQQAADAQLTQAQRRLFEARDAMQAQALRTSEAKATHAALVERGGALLTEVQRLEEAAAELESRVAGRRDELSRAETRRTHLQTTIASSEARLDADLRTFDGLRDRVRVADNESQSLRARFDEQEATIREARRTLDAVRAEAAQLDVTRATAETDLSHLAASCVEAVQTTLDDVAAEVDQLEQEGLLASARPVDDAPEAAETGEDQGTVGEDQGPVVSGFSRTGAEADQAIGAADAAPSSATLTPDGMVADLRAKIERMGAVNMMAIDQFDDLESRHTFLTAQRKDLVDSITATGEAIKKIDRTTKERFREAFTAINLNFEGTFTTLFGGGRAGLVLLDESDQLESGIDIIAQPPGKRLQSVQLLSGGEKALTAMALMFAIFKYRPSPFCLLDEIDAPLDDANIGRFVEMLQGMQEHTQFILITHNRKTMEIADRLYGITMEEPGVSKLISVQLN